MAPAESCDSALSTFILCTIRDVQRALAEVHRVMRPGTRLHFLEHGLSPDRRVARVASNLLQLRLGDGCHLTRDPSVFVEHAGF